MPPVGMGRGSPDPQPTMPSPAETTSRRRHGHRPYAIIRRPRAHSDPPEADERDVVGLHLAGGELANLLDDRPADRRGAAGRLRHALRQTAVVFRVVKL